MKVSQRLAFPNFLLHVSAFLNVVYHSFFLIIKCYSLPTTTEVYTFLNYYTMINQACYFSLKLTSSIDVLKYWNIKKKIKGKRVLQKIYRTLLHCSPQYLVNFFVFNHIFYSQNSEFYFKSWKNKAKKLGRKWLIFCNIGST